MSGRRSPRLLALALCWLAVLSPGCRGGEGAEDHAHHEEEAAGHDEHGDEHGEEQAVVELSPEAIERIGLATATASIQPLVGRRATTGEVGFDETRLAHVAPRVSGRLIRVEAELGERMREGEALAVLDSAELGEARADYLRARARQEVAQRRLEREQSLLADGITSHQEVLEAEAVAREAASDLAAAAQALRLLGLSAGQVSALTWDDASASLVTVRAPFAGTVVAREATRGELVTPERNLFTIADLGHVWVWVDLYERDLRHVRRGEQVEVRFDAWPGDTFRGELAYVADQLDPQSRTVRARVDLPNPDGRLKAGMFATVLIDDSGEGAESAVLTVPREAVQRGGEGSVVFVRTAPGRFERREVEVGRVTDRLAEVRSGLAAGEEVVTEGAFLLESQASADELGGHHH